MIISLSSLASLLSYWVMYKYYSFVCSVLYKNNFSGVIPNEIGGLTMLELLDLRSNNLSGRIPVEIGEMLSLKCL